MGLSAAAANQRFIVQYQQRGNSQIPHGQKEPLSLPDACSITSPNAIFRTDVPFALQHAFRFQRLNCVPDSADRCCLRNARYKPVALIMSEQEAVFVAVLTA